MFPLPLNRGIYKRIEVIPNHNLQDQIFERIMEGFNNHSLPLFDIQISLTEGDEGNLIEVSHNLYSLETIDIPLTKENRQIITAINIIGIPANAFTPSWIWSRIDDYIEIATQDYEDQNDIPEWANKKYMDKAFPKWARAITDKLPKKYKKYQKLIDSYKASFALVNFDDAYDRLPVSIVFNPFLEDIYFLYEPFIADELNSIFENHTCSFAIHIENDTDIDNAIIHIRHYFFILQALEEIINDYQQSRN